MTSGTKVHCSDREKFEDGQPHPAGRAGPAATAGDQQVDVPQVLAADYHYRHRPEERSGECHTAVVMPGLPTFTQPLFHAGM